MYYCSHKHLFSSNSFPFSAVCYSSSYLQYLKQLMNGSLAHSQQIAYIRVKKKVDCSSFKEVISYNFQSLKSNYNISDRRNLIQNESFYVFVPVNALFALFRKF